jgi:hypothetical protein
MTAHRTEKARESLAKAAELYCRSGDPFAPSWDGMTETERDFWLGASRLPRRWAAFPRSAIPPEVRDRVKNYLYRAAERAKVLLKPCLALRGLDS